MDAKILQETDDLDQVSTCNPVLPLQPPVKLIGRVLFKLVADPVHDVGCTEAGNKRDYIDVVSSV